MHMFLLTNDLMLMSSSSSVSLSFVGSLNTSLCSKEGWGEGCFKKITIIIIFVIRDNDSMMMVINSTCTYLSMWYIQSVHTYMYTCIITYIHKYIHMYVCTYVHTYMYICTITYIRKYIHTYVCTYIHTYIHT